MLLIFCLLIFLPYPTFCYRIPPTDISTLHENTETVVDVDRSPKRFHLEITNHLSPFFLYITPCGAPVHWQLFTIQNEISESEEIAIFSDPSISFDESDKFRLIAGEEDTKRMTFFAHHLPKRLILVLSTTSSATSSTRIFFSPSLFRTEHQYPPLPPDTRLAVTIENHQPEVEARIAWKIAPHVRAAHVGRYRTCAIVSRREPVWAPQCDGVEEGVEMVRCVPATNNSLLVRDLRRETAYFLTVFVRDSLTGATSSYPTHMIETGGARKVPRGIARRHKKPVPRLLLNSKLQATNLEGKRGAYVNYKFPITPSTTIHTNGTQTVMLIIHACDGLVRLNIFRNSKILRRTDAFGGFRRFVVTNLKSGSLRFQIVNDDEQSKTVRIWASTDLATSPYPILPDDTSVKVVARTCSSISIQWLRALDTNIKYCAYIRKENSNFLEQLVSLVDNLCEGGLTSSTLVGCYSHTPSTNDATTSLIETTIGGLGVASTYRVDLLAIPIDRVAAQPLPYRTVWVRTNQSCW